MAAQLYKTETGQLFHAGKIALMMVGLPGSGNTHNAQRLGRYLRWLGVQTHVFTVSLYRRQRFQGHYRFTHEFFDPENHPFSEIRRELAKTVLDDMMEWFEGGGQVGIYDSCNTSRERREFLSSVLTSKGVQVVFIESIVSDESIVEENIQEVVRRSPDYAGFLPEDAYRDYQLRIAHFARTYQPIQEVDVSYIQSVNVGEKIIVNRIEGYLQTRIVYFMMNVHGTPRSIYFLCVDPENGKNEREHEQLWTRVHGRLQKIRQGSDHEGKDLQVWTCMDKNTLECGQFFPSLIPLKALDAINVGVCRGLQDQEIREQYPMEYEAHVRDPYNHRFPRAESYHDLAIRLEPVILELEREENDVLIVADETVLRCMYAYILDHSENEIPLIFIPKHVLLEILPRAYYTTERRWKILSEGEVHPEQTEWIQSQVFPDMVHRIPSHSWC